MSCRRFQGVTLKRWLRRPARGATPPAVSPESVDAAGDRHDLIEIADAAFEADKEIEEPGIATVTRFDPSRREERRTLPSQEVLLHEVGHASEAFERRKADAAHLKSDVEDTKKLAD